MDITPADIADLLFDPLASIDQTIKSRKALAHRLVIVDNLYRPLALQQLQSAMASDPELVPVAGPQPEIRDCDDFALHLKSTLTLRARREVQVGDRPQPPPAIGIVITTSHALNIFVALNAQREPYLGIVDASIEGQPIVREPAKAAALFQTLPIRLIYF